MSAFAHIYRSAQADEPLRQGEILSDLIRFRIDPRTVGPIRPRVGLQIAGGTHFAPYITTAVQIATPNVLKVSYSYVVVVSQDCDLEQQGRPDGNDLKFPTVLLAEAVPATELRGRGLNSAMWKLVKENREERYHFLQAVADRQDAVSEGVPELGLDFKRYLGIPTDELYQLVDAGLVRRRAILNSPYMEHLCCRFGNYLNRVALPEPHFSTPAEA